MPYSVKPYLPLLLFLILTPLSSAGQSSPANKKPAGDIYSGQTKGIIWLQSGTHAVHEFTFWGGYGFDSMVFWGKTPDARFRHLGIGYNRKLLLFRNHLLEYRSALNLYVNYSYPGLDQQEKRNRMNGIGFSPLGFQYNFHRNRQLQPYLGTSAGFMIMDGPFPDERGERINFTLSLGGGLEVFITSHTSLQIGYRFFHFSNGYRGMVNPGIDSNSLYVALSLF